jgi:hypothetical protein
MHSPQIKSEPTPEMKQFKTMSKLEMANLSQSQQDDDSELAKQARALYDYEPDAVRSVSAS